MNTSINGARILQAMVAKGLKVVDVCALCGVNNKTLAKVLRGEKPRRIDALMRVVVGLEIPPGEVIIAGTDKTADKVALRLVRVGPRSDVRVRPIR